MRNYLLVHPPLRSNLVARCGWRPWTYNTKVQNIVHVILDDDWHGLVASDRDYEGSFIDHYINGFPNNPMAIFFGASLTGLFVQILQLLCRAASFRLQAAWILSAALNRGFGAFTSALGVPAALKREHIAVDDREQPVRIGQDVDLGDVGAAQHVIPFVGAGIQVRLTL